MNTAHQGIRPWSKRNQGQHGRLRLRFAFLPIALSKPVFERDLSELRVVFGNECSLFHLDAVVASVRVSDNLARILACGSTPPDKFIEANLFRTTYFNGAIL